MHRFNPHIHEIYTKREEKENFHKSFFLLLNQAESENKGENILA